MLTLAFLCDKPTKATAISWLNGEPIAAIQPDFISESTTQCTNQKVRVGSSQGPLVSVCVYQAKDFKYGMYANYIPTSAWAGYTEYSFVVGFPSDQAMYKVQGLPDKDPPIYIANSNTLLYRSFLPWSSWGYMMKMVSNLPSRLTKTYSNDLLHSVEYRLAEDAYETFIPNEEGEYTMTRSVSISKNGKWAAVELRPGGLMRVNLLTGEKKWFSRYEPTYGQGNDGLIEFAVSDDGKHIAVVGMNVVPQIYELSDSCGKSAPTFYKEWRLDSSNLTNPCPSKDLTDIIDTVRGGDLRFVRQPQFNDDAGELSVYTYVYIRPGKTNDEKWVTLRANGYIPRTLDYLALGDSYSSGEGDTAVNPQTHQKYYREWTDNERDDNRGVLREKCHLSTRSYPYILANLIKLSINQRWNSVACSGAVKNSVSPADEHYKGQDNRLASLSPDQRNTHKIRALNEFIPEREKQIEFVKQYPPSVITLTMGGNDAGFEKVLSACVNPFQEWVSTCSYVTNNRQKQNIAKSIRNQYEPLRKLYKTLYEVSGQKAKIYVLGYPQFVNEEAENTSCSINVRLNKPERHMINESVRYMNAVIKAAAESAGVKYIDTEHSLDGHRLCDDKKKAVTGIALWMSSETQESFHPNNYGHSLIAGAFFRQLEWQSPIDFVICPSSGTRICPNNDITEPSTPDYFQEAIGSSNRNSSHQQLTPEDSPATKLTPLHIMSSPISLDPDSPVSIILYSEPKRLGTFTPNADGSLDAIVTIPENVPTGYHTLVLAGKTFSGEDIDLWQIIQVQGGDPNDRDEDGIPDSQDACLYIQSSHQDQDNDSIDDACDPLIGDSQELEAASQAVLADLKQKYALANGMHSGEIGSSDGAQPYDDATKPIKKVSQTTSVHSKAVPPLLSHWQLYSGAAGLIGVTTLSSVWIRKKRLERKYSNLHTNND